MEKLAVSTSPTQLTEGVAPDATGLTLNQIEATVEQYGVVVRISDLAELTAKHNMVERCIYVLGLQAAELYDQLIFNALSTGATSVYRPHNRADDAHLIGSDHLDFNDLIEIDALQMDAAARPFEGGDYVFVVAPQVYACFLKDPDFKAAAQMQAPERIWKAEVANLAGFRIVRSNAPGFSPATTTASGSSNKVYSSFAIGRFSYAITDLQGLRVYMVAPGGQLDPLQQARKIGWKFCFKSAVVNTNWIRLVKSSGLNSATN